MANIDIVSIDGDNFIDLGTEGIKSLVATNTMKMLQSIFA